MYYKSFYIEIQCQICQFFLINKLNFLNGEQTFCNYVIFLNKFFFYKINFYIKKR